MPQFSTTSEQGRLAVRLKAAQMAEQDITCYGPIRRDTTALAERAQYHIKQLDLARPTPETILTDHKKTFARLFSCQYKTVYQGLLVGHTGLKESFRLQSTPHFRSFVTFGPGEPTPILGRSELLERLRQEQEKQRTSGKALFSQMSVSIHKQQSDTQSHITVVYQICGDTITGINEQPEGCEDLLRGLDLPTGEAYNWARETPCQPGNRAIAETHE